MLSLKIAADIPSKTDRIVLIGVEPDRPDVGFGYIQKGEICKDTQRAFDVKAFKEKPDYAMAQEYLNSGQYLWNGGYFVASLNTFLAAIKAHAPELSEHYQQLHTAKHDAALKK